MAAGNKNIKNSLLMFFALGLGGCLGQTSDPQINFDNNLEPDLNNNTMQISSTAFAPGTNIPRQYTCDGENISPPLTFSDVPAGARSLVLIMDDPDALKPAGKVWDHWLVWNISASTSTVSEDRNPPGIVGFNTSGKKGYGGPCPPDGEHRYFFKLYARDADLDLPFNAVKADIEKAMTGHILDKTQLMGRYSR